MPALTTDLAFILITTLRNVKGSLSYQSHLTTDKIIHSSVWTSFFWVLDSGSTTLTEQDRIQRVLLVGPYHLLSTANILALHFRNDLGIELGFGVVEFCLFTLNTETVFERSFSTVLVELGEKARFLAQLREVCLSGSIHHIDSSLSGLEISNCPCMVISWVEHSIILLNIVVRPPRVDSVQTEVSIWTDIHDGCLLGSKRLQLLDPSTVGEVACLLWDLEKVQMCSTQWLLEIIDFDLLSLVSFVAFFGDNLNIAVARWDWS